MGDVCPSIFSHFMKQTHLSIAHRVLMLVQPLLQEYILWIKATCLTIDEFTINSSISCHYPLHRCLADIFIECCGVPHALKCFIELLQNCLPENEEHRKILYEYPLRAIVQAAQVHANLWVRNGSTVSHHLINYSEPACLMRTTWRFRFEVPANRTVVERLE